MKKSKILGTDSQRYLDALDPSLFSNWKHIYSQMNQSSFNIEQAVLENGHQKSDMVKDCYTKTSSSSCNFKRSFDLRVRKLN
jgi:hypothetical protein